jgi:hypothetical protein
LVRSYKEEYMTFYVILCYCITVTAEDIIWFKAIT